MIGYDDPESIAIKVNYTLQRGLGGVMIWVRLLDLIELCFSHLLIGFWCIKSIDQDDSTGYACNQGKFPLLGKIYDLMWNETTRCTTTTTTTTVASQSIYNRTKFITPVWKRSTKYYFNKDYRGRMGRVNSAEANMPIYFRLMSALFVVCLSISF